MGSATGNGKDLDQAILAATNNLISQGRRLQSIVRLTFSARNMPNLDTFTRSDGMLVLYEKRGNIWQLIGISEVQKSNLNPDWLKCFDLQYKFEE